MNPGAASSHALVNGRLERRHERQQRVYSLVRDAVVYTDSQAPDRVVSRELVESRSLRGQQKGSLEFQVAVEDAYGNGGTRTEVRVHSVHIEPL